MEKQWRQLYRSISPPYVHQRLQAQLWRFHLSGKENNASVKFPRKPSIQNNH